MIKTGIPAKKKILTLLKGRETNGDCFADGDKLYLLKFAKSYDSEFGTKVEVIDMSQKDFDKREQLLDIDIVSAVYIIAYRDHYILGYDQSQVYEKTTGKKIFSGYDFLPEQDSTERIRGTVRLTENYIIHQPNVDIETTNLYGCPDSEFIKQVEMDFSTIIDPLENDHVCGIRANGNFAVYSLNDSSYTFELNSKEYNVKTFSFQISIFVFVCH